MVKWEYKVLYLIGTGQETLDELGSRGWELVTIIPGSDDWEMPRAYFKRPVKNARGPFIAGPVITVNLSDVEKDKMGMLNWEKAEWDGCYSVNISDAEKNKLKGNEDVTFHITNKENVYTFDPATGKEVLMGKIVNKKKELLFQFRAMVLELIEAGNMIPSEIKHKAYDLIDSCYDKDGELIE